MQKIDGVEALTPAQRTLVEENLGLIGVHLRRNVTNLHPPRHNREWDDLFQEGCIGLIVAAKRYDKSRQIPFAAFALPRIHKAVSRALHKTFAGKPSPKRRRARIVDEDDRPVLDRHAPCASPQVVALPHDAADRMADRPRADPHSPDDLTIGDRMRLQYEEALSRAAAGARQAGRRDDGGRLVDMMVAGRFQVADEEDRTPLRQLARETESSYARVAQCEKRIAGAIRRQLEHDPEFVELRHRQRRSEGGVHSPYDGEVRRSIAAREVHMLTDRYLHADPSRRARFLLLLSPYVEPKFEQFVRASVSRLPAGARTRLLRATEAT